MKKIIFMTILSVLSVNAQYPSGEEILDNIDKNMSANNRITESKMVIHGQRGSRTIESKSWAEGVDKAFTEYTAPAREKGTKMLKLENNLWLYSPATDRTISISGHMLRQSVMGSDLSYEDMMEDPKLKNLYFAVVIGTEVIDAQLCWIVELTAKTKDIAYHMRKLWVNQKFYIPLKEELYAKSGKLLKKLEFKDIIQVQGRWYPSRMIFKDMLKTGKGTEFIIESIKFDQDIPSYIFTKATLRR
jgi:outer membrane lipoprotein-sorting protein